MASAKQRLLNYKRVEQAMAYINQNFQTQPSLTSVAEAVHLSPFRFQRLFKEWVGISPKRFLQFVTIEFLRKKIHEAANNHEAADMAGLSSVSRLHDLFVSIEAATPSQYRSSGKGLQIFYGYHPSPFGMCFVAASERGVCSLKFVDTENASIEWQKFLNQWRFASITYSPERAKETVRQIFAPSKQDPNPISALVKGTNFQLKVWEALTKVPYGTVASFRQIAHTIGHPNAIRAVGSAVGKNPILYLIPCHRIISESGTMGNYHGGKTRKLCMIGWEMANL